MKVVITPPPPPPPPARPKSEPAPAPAPPPPPTIQYSTLESPALTTKLPGELKICTLCVGVVSTIPPVAVSGGVVSVSTAIVCARAYLAAALES